MDLLAQHAPIVMLTPQTMQDHDLVAESALGIDGDYVRDDQISRGHLVTLWSGVPRRGEGENPLLLPLAGGSRNKVFQSRTCTQAVNFLKMRVERQQRGTVLQ